MSQLEDMQIFVATVDAASFTAASVKLGLSKQFVSRRIMALARGVPATPAELKDHHCVLYGHSKGVEWLFEHDGKPWPVAVTGRLRVNNGEVARDAAIAGLGIAWLPTFIVGPALQGGQLVTILDNYAPRPATVFAVYPQHRQAFLAIRAFVDFLGEALAPK